MGEGRTIARIRGDRLFLRKNFSVSAQNRAVPQSKARRFDDNSAAVA